LWFSVLENWESSTRPRFACPDRSMTATKGQDLVSPGSREAAI
jgi:hypothetical protein